MKEINRLADKGESERLSALETGFGNLSEKVEHIERSLINLATEIRSAISELHKKSQVDWKALSVISGLLVTIITGYLYLILSNYTREANRAYEVQNQMLIQLVEIQKNAAVNASNFRAFEVDTEYKLKETRSHIELAKEHVLAQDKLVYQQVDLRINNLREYVDERTKDRIYRSEVEELKSRLNRVEEMHIKNQHQ